MGKKYFEHIKCNICGSDDYSIVYKDRHGKVKEQELVDKFRSSGDETLVDQVVKCKKCGLVYVNPRIRADWIIKGYCEGKDEVFVSQAKGRELTFAESLKFIRRYSKRGRILDIGTAGGSFLHVAKKVGWDVYGVEPNKWLCNWGKKHYGIDIKQGTIFDHKFPSDFFDVVTLWDVLEHTPDPTKVLKECNRLLKKNGLLVINYPDIGSWLARIMKCRWAFLLSVHLFYFDRRTIKIIFDKTGFKPILFKPHFQKLALGYLIFRMKAYSKFLHKTGSFFTKILHMENLQIPYWLGQTLVVARKK